MIGHPLRSVSALLAAILLGGTAARGGAIPVIEPAVGRDAVPLPGKWTASDEEWGSTGVVWRSFRAEVPASWSGRRVRVEIPGALHKCDAVVFVNGRRAGDILRPGFEGVEATSLVRFGATNEVRFLLTESGAETARGETRSVTKLHYAKKGPSGENPLFAARPAVFVNDVFANTSWRMGRCDFEVEVDRGGDASAAASLRLSVECADAAGNPVWRGERRILPPPGRSVHALSMPWDESVVPWELGRPALYTARVMLRGPAATDETAVRFGFREVWREGREIMMNGHRAHFRPVYSYGARNGAALRFLQSMGFNVVFRGHSRDAVGVTDQDLFAVHDECGVGLYANAGAYDVIGADHLNDDPAMREEFRRFVRVYQRQVRNHPSLLAGIVGSMSKTNQRFGPATIGRSREPKSDRGAQIEQARALHREANPNILYFSHADGPHGDIDSGNVYLNWTPVQEQESWLEQWGRDGEYPWSSIEFLAPYPGDFVKSSVFLGTEFLAAQFGDRAYREETAEALARVPEATRTARSHGSPVGNELLRGSPLYLDLRREWTWRCNSRWRAFGLNGGNMWFNLGEGHGEPPGWTGRDLRRYSALSDEEFSGGRPPWANTFYDIHRLGNLDFCGFLGGADADDSPGAITDRTHAYVSGEPVEKRLVMIWDGVGERRIDATWSVSAVADGNPDSPIGPPPVVILPPVRVSAAIAQGEQVRVPVSFAAPDVAERTVFRLTATFAGDEVEPFDDSFDFEVWPAVPPPTVSSGAKVALFDPSGEGAAVLHGVGVKFHRIGSVAELPAAATHLVVGRDALEKASLDRLAPRVAEGLRVFVMRQTAETWKRMGFRVEDLMLREVFPRDPAFSTLPQDALREWRGTPDYPNAPYGKVMSHAFQRGPRGPRRHAVAGLVLQTPERPGYLPMLVGGFDLGYSALLRFAPPPRRGGGRQTAVASAGEREFSSPTPGDITYCTLDFERRVGVCPAATATARAVFGEFLGRIRPSPLAALFVCDETRAKAAGFALGPETTIFRAEVPDDPAFRGVGPGDARWPSGLAIRPLRGPGATPDGAFAVKRLPDDRRIVFSQVPEGRFAARASARDPSAEPGPANAERLDEGRVRRLYARLRANCATRDAGGPPPAAALRRALHQAGLAQFEPLPAMHLLGPFAAGRDDGALQLDTVWNEKAERMAASGDFDPNHEFPLPQGGTANWRPMLAPDREGRFDFAAAQPASSFPVTYAICHVERRTAGEAVLRLGGDWRFAVWCNGKEVFRTYRGARVPRMEVKVDLRAGDNVLAFKVGAGSGGHALIALLSPERDDRGPSDADPELDAMTLYEDDIPGFDPYEFHYW